MSRNRLRWVPRLALASAALMCAMALRAEDYPSRRIALVVPVLPGTSSDALGRVVAERLSSKDRLGRPVVVETIPGARSFIGYARVAESRPDGYTMLLVGPQVTLPRELTPAENFDPAKLAPLGRLASAPYMVAVARDVPANTLADFIRYARFSPRMINVAAILNTTLQLDERLFEKTLGIELMEVPYKTSPAMAQALLGGHVHMAFLPSWALPYIDTGKLKALAVTSPRRWPRLPSVPTVHEFGFDFDAGLWYGIAVPIATPSWIQEILVREIAAVMAQPELRAAIGHMGLEPLDPQPEDMRRQMERDRQRAEAGARLLDQAARLRRESEE